VSRFDRVVPEIEERGTVLRDPVTEDQLLKTEERLGVSLPPSYRAFLLISNGAYASPVGAETVVASGPTRHGLLPVEEVAPAAKADASTVALWTGLDGLNDPEQDEPPTTDEPMDVGCYEPLRRGLLVSRPLEAWRSVLVPRDGLVEWELWDMERDGAGAYRSFADFLGFQVRRSSWMPEPGRADEYAEAVRRGELQKLDALAEIGDPRARELAERWLESDQLVLELDRMWPARVLRKLADPASIPALLRAYERATVDDYRIALLAALEAAGAAEARELLRAAAKDADPDVSSWASRILSGPASKA